MRRWMQIALVAAGLAAIPVALAIAQDDGDSVSGASGPGASQAQSAPPQGPEVNHCPSSAESRAHYEQYGFDYKPQVRCGSGAQVEDPPPDAGPDEAPPVVASSIAEAQRVFDPRDDPNVLVGKDPGGQGYIGLHVTTLNPIPPDVKTFEEFREWAKTQPPPQPRP